MNPGISKDNRVYNDHEKKVNRNKEKDANGEEYDRRKGSYSAIDKTYKEFAKILNTWLTIERILVELEIMNKDKVGEPYKYPPSLILYLSLHKSNLGLSYRRLIAEKADLMEFLGLPVPSYSTFSQSEKKFFGPGVTLGIEIQKKASEILKERGIKDDIDIWDLINTGVCPNYTAPQKIPVCEKDVLEQKVKDEAAEEYRTCMEVTVLGNAVSDNVPRRAALDGSGQGYLGPGIYFEKVWNMNNRRFIKQHAVIDMDTQEPLMFAITFEKPGDAAMMVPILEGAEKAGLVIEELNADSAYDTIANWKYADAKGISFNPNLKFRFGEKFELNSRNLALKKEKELGKKEYHRVSGYNDRWLIEAFFSFLKKMFGERVRAYTFPKMVIEMKRMYQLASLFKRLYAKARGYVPRSVQMSNGAES